MLGADASPWRRPGRVAGDKEIVLVGAGVRAHQRRLVEVAAAPEPSTGRLGGGSGTAWDSNEIK